MRTYSCAISHLLLSLALFIQPGFSQASLHSIELDDLDRKADPCGDFYQFANGTWRAKNRIPASMTPGNQLPWLPTPSASGC